MLSSLMLLPFVSVKPTLVPNLFFRWRVVATLKICYDCYDWNAAFQKSTDGGAKNESPVIAITAKKPMCALCGVVGVAHGRCLVFAVETLAFGMQPDRLVTDVAKLLLAVRRPFALGADVPFQSDADVDVPSILPPRALFLERGEAAFRSRPDTGLDAFASPFSSHHCLYAP